MKLYKLIIILAVGMLLLLSACSAPAASPTTAPTAVIDTPTAVPEATLPEPTTPADTPTAVPAPDTLPLSVDFSGLAQEITSQVIPEVSPEEYKPWWEVMPKHTVLTLQGYPVSGHLMKPQIFIYPVGQLGINEAAGGVATSLKALLASQQVDEAMPYLPPYNAAQVMHAQVKFLDFKNGKGVRFLTQYDQGILPLNNHEILYTFQGLTSDGKTYIAVVLPINLTGLPADENDTANLPDDFVESFPKYLADAVEMVEKQPASAFTPDLSALDALIQSSEVK